MSTPVPARNPRRLALFVWSGLVAGLLTAFAVAGLARPAGAEADPELTRMLTLAATLVAVVDAAVSRLLPRLMPRRASEPLDQRALRQTVVAASLSASTALCCVVVWVLTGTPWILAALALAMGGLVACFPGPGRWEALGGEPALRRWSDQAPE